MGKVLAWRRNNDRKKTSGRHSFRKGGVGVTVDEA
uniref:Uncharacterized protein n=1 Tax=Arundo donax TaxID=35708 RepID=A0A0A8YDP0_ARUDO